jgi:TonB-dependent receptor
MPPFSVRSNTVLLAGFLTAVSALATPTRAADAADSSTSGEQNRSTSALEEIVVLSQRTTDEVALAAQKEASNLINITTASQIARLPDINTGEAIRRVPGISLETDTGEGRYINIRGLDADLNSTTFGGLRLPPTNTSSPSGAGRAVALDSIPTGFIGAITVTKSNLPEQDAEALGGTIDITPKTAPPGGKPFLDLKLGSGEELQRHTGITDLSFDAGTRFGGSADYQPFSILLVGSIYNDGRGIDDNESGFWDEQSAGVPDKAVSAIERRYYQYHRRRHGYGFDFGYEPNDGAKYFIRYYESGYTELKFRDMLQWNFQDPGTDPSLAVPAPGNRNGILAAVDSVRVGVEDEKETLTQRVAEIGGRNRLGDNTLDYHVGYTKGSYYKPYDYNSTFTNPGLATAIYDNTTQPNWSTVTPVSPAGFDPLNPAGYTLSRLTNQRTDIKDHEWGIGANLAIPTHFTDRSDEELKFGLNARIRTKTGNQTSYAFAIDQASALPLAAAVSGSPVTYYDDHYTIPPLVNVGTVRNYYAANSALVSTNPVANLLNSVHDDENVYAGYGQYQFGYGPLGVIAGVRVENTRATYSAYKQDATGLSCPMGQVCPVSTDRTYTNFFPTAQARYEISPDLIGRLALSSTVARPGFEQVTAATTVDGSGNVITGNPGLKPTRATGLDLSIEKYLPNAGIASLGLFGKYIQDYIVTEAVPLGGQVSGGNLGIAKLYSFTNGMPARVYGVEANFVKRFRDELPGVWGGLGVSANWTWVDSWYSVPVNDANGNTTMTRVSVLPSTSRNTANAELLYQKYGLDLSLGAYLASRNIFTQGPTAATDTWTQDRVSVDFGGRYQILESLSVYVAAKNLTNTPLKFTDGKNENRVIQRELYGVTLLAGVNLKF